MRPSMFKPRTLAAVGAVAAVVAVAACSSGGGTSASNRSTGTVTVAARACGYRHDRGHGADGRERPGLEQGRSHE